jgi:hypothetical protein
VETFELSEREASTELVYRGELGIDFWVFGKLAGRYWVTPTWRSIVEHHLADVKALAESRRRRVNAGLR